MLTATDLAYFDDILTLIQLGHVYLQFYKFSCSRTKLLSFLYFRQKNASSSSIPFSDIYKNQRGRKKYNISIRLRLVLLMNLMLNNFQQNMH